MGTSLVGQAAAAQMSNISRRFFGAARVRIDPTLTGVCRIRDPPLLRQLRQQIRCNHEHCGRTDSRMARNIPSRVQRRDRIADEHQYFARTTRRPGKLIGTIRLTKPCLQGSRLTGDSGS